MLFRIWFHPCFHRFPLGSERGNLDRMLTHCRSSVTEDDFRAQVSCSELSGQHEWSVQNCLGRRLVRHALDMQVHRQLDFDPISDAPAPLEFEVAARTWPDVGDTSI